MDYTVALKPRRLCMFDFAVLKTQKKIVKFSDKDVLLVHQENDLIAISQYMTLNNKNLVIRKTQSEIVRLL